jgi:hypothetical protein
MSISVQQVKDAISNCTNLVKQYAVLPPQYLNKLMEDDVREFNCVRVLQSIVDGSFTLVADKKDPMYIPSQFYKNYSVGAAKYALEFLSEEGDECEGDECEGDECCEPGPYCNEVDPELLRLLRGNAPANRVILPARLRSY